MTKSNQKIETFTKSKSFWLSNCTIKIRLKKTLKENLLAKIKNWYFPHMKLNKKRDMTSIYTKVCILWTCKDLGTSRLIVNSILTLSMADNSTSNLSPNSYHSQVMRKTWFLQKTVCPK